MGIPTLILTPRYTPDAQLLWGAAHALGWGVHRLRSWRVSDDPDVGRYVVPVLYVEALMAQTIGEELGVRLEEPPDDFLPNLPEKYRRRFVGLTTLKAARSDQDARQWFYKPPNDKSFKAGVYSPAELPTYLDDDMPVLMAEPVEWTVEVRCFVLNKRVYTASSYLRNGKLDMTLEGDVLYTAMGFAQTALNDVDVPDPIVLDVGYIKERGWAVVEVNAVWGSGIYNCDPKQVLEVLRRSMHYISS